MSAIIHNSFRKFNADNFIDFIDGTPKVLYLGIGKQDPWNGNSPGQYEDGTYSDISIPVPIDTTIAPYLHHADLLAIKKITAPSTSHVIKRVDWTSGVVYPEYHHNTHDIIEQDFFVMTDQYNVYKCISNFNGAQSSIKPIGQSDGIIETPDNYKWKFMFEIQQADVLTFVTPDWIPVNSPATSNQPDQVNVEAGAVDGALDYIKVVSGGTGYRSHLNTSPETGTINTIKLESSASNTNDFYKDMTVYISSGIGEGQMRTISSYDGTTKIAIVSSDWSTIPSTSSVYQVMPAISITHPTGSSGTVTARVSAVSGGSITKISMMDVGSLYRSATSTITSGGGTNATVEPIIGPPGGHGKNAVSELGGAFVMLNTRLIGFEESIIPIDDDFRKVHLIVNPYLSDGVTLASASVVAASDLQPGSGSWIYSEFRAPINRAADSTEDIKLVVEF